LGKWRFISEGAGPKPGDAFEQAIEEGNVLIADLQADGVYGQIAVFQVRLGL